MKASFVRQGNEQKGSRLVTLTEQGRRFQQKHFGFLTPPSINQVVSSQPVGCRR